jgi:hypothetical protein
VLIGLLHTSYLNALALLLANFYTFVRTLQVTADIACRFAFHLNKIRREYLAVCKEVMP